MLIYIGTPMVAASLWKRSDIDRIEASLYRKVLRIGNMVSNRAILNTMTNIRLAGEVTNYLSKEAWEQFRRQNRVTAFFIQKEETERTNSAAGHRPSDREPLPRREKIYVPKIMLNMMLATTSNSTSVHYGMDHMCHRHKRLFTLDHIETCDQLTGCQKIRGYANKLKEKPLLEWDKQERFDAIGAFALLTI
jgi:hypothetical protein